MEQNIPIISSIKFSTDDIAYSFNAAELEGQSAASLRQSVTITDVLAGDNTTWILTCGKAPNLAQDT